MSSINPSDLSKIRSSRAYHALLGAWSEPAMLACSGGIDSTAMLLLSAQAFKSGKIAPFIVVHVDHLTRQEVAAENTFVGQLCNNLCIPFVSVIVRSPPETSSANIESRLRQLRYSRLASLAQRIRIASVVTAHTRDDQIETILMRMLSGASAISASGMKPVTDLQTEDGTIRIIRPLLGTTRVELVKVLRSTGIHALEDPSNTDRSFRRNALRHDIVPGLKRIFPGFDKSLSRAIELAARDARYVDSQAVEAGRFVIHWGENHVSVDRGFVATKSPALVSRVLRSVVIDLMGDLEENVREVTFERIESVRTAASGRTGAVIQLPGNIDVLMEQNELRFVLRNSPEKLY